MVKIHINNKMEVTITAYRNRIGSFNTAGRFIYKPTDTRKKSYKSSTRYIYNFRKLALQVILIISITSNSPTVLQNEVQDSKIYYNYSSIATATPPVSFFILGSQDSAAFFPVFHLSYHDVLGVHSAATLQGVQAVPLDRGWIVAAVPLQSSILSDSNFYARITYGNRSNRGIKLSHWNAGSAFLENKINEIEHVISDHHPHLLGISEANLLKSHCLDNSNIADYSLITCKTMNNWLSRQNKFLVFNLYRDWQYLRQADHSSLDMSEQLARWVIFIDQWDRALNTGKECVVMGDFNLDFLSFYRTDLPSSSQTHRLQPLLDELFSRIVPHGVKQCVVGPTRQGWVGQADSGLDHLWTNMPGKMSQIYTQYNGSDHKVIMGVRFAKMVKSSTRYVKKRSYKFFDEVKFLEKIRNTSWWDLYQTTDVNVAVELFTSKVNCILDKMAPIKTFQTNSKYCPWLTLETKEIIRERNKAQKTLSENKNDENFAKFKNLRNKVTKNLKSDKIMWQKQKLENCNNDPGKLWKNILGWINWCSSGSPTKLYHAGQIVTSPSKLADIMNNFFVDKVAKIRQDLPNPTDDPLRTVKHTMKDRTSEFSLSFVHPDTVRKIILQLKNSKSSGADNIDTYILKLMVEDILPAVTHIVNLSIQQATFPSLYKMAKIIPLLKKDDPLEPKNYRPVAILCILSKVIERVVFIQIVEYMNTNDYFHPNHHGFRAHHSTSTAMVQMYDSWVQAADKGELAGVCMLDMSAAFDVVDHSILLKKLKLYGFDVEALNWMENYLSGRTQAVYIDGALSSYLPVNVGVPQGSILGPLCYVMFTNDLPETVLDTRSHVHWSHLTTHCADCGGLCCFADDSTYTVSSPDQDILTQKLTEKYLVLADYMNNNRLKLNDDKTHLLIMTTKQKHRLLQIDVKISTPSEVIKPIKSEKLLGIFIQDDLKWSDYIQNNDKSLVKQLTTRLNALRIISKVASFKVRLMIANGIFCSKLIFQISLWGGAEGYLLKSLQTVQNKAARLVTRRGRYTPVAELLRQCGWLSVGQLTYYHSVILVHKTMQTTYPKYIYNKLSSEFPYNTRLAQSDVVRMGPDFKSRLEITEKSFMQRATISYNTLPTSIRQTQKLQQFKKNLKAWVLENICIYSGLLGEF